MKARNWNTKRQMETAAGPVYGVWYEMLKHSGVLTTTNQCLRLVVYVHPVPCTITTQYLLSHPVVKVSNVTRPCHAKYNDRLTAFDPGQPG